MSDTIVAGLWRTEAAPDFARSDLFERTFREGMDLVEETAGYLDGAGRQEARLLSRNAALAYAAASMALSTRLMQVASWLLVQRAVREGAMAPEAAREDRYRLSSETVRLGEDDGVPPALTGLLDRAERLYERIAHLDRRIYGEVGPAPHPVLAQHDRLKSAFGA